MSALILHGGKRSPFVRRVAIWLGLQDRSFERRAVNIFGSDFEGFLAHNPLGRVPVLSTPEGDLIETSAILDYLEMTATADKRLIPTAGRQRIDCQQRMALANGIAEKGVAFVYETERRPDEAQWSDWIDRLSKQVNAGMAALERIAPETAWLGGERPDGSDVATIATVDFLKSINGLNDLKDMPRLAALAERSRSTEAFAATHPDA